MAIPAENYRYEFVSNEVFKLVFEQYRDDVFGDHLTANVHQFYSEEEKQRNQILADQMKPCTVLDLVAYDGDKVIGWSSGDQMGKSIFYMRNSAVLAEYRRQGIYSHMLKLMMQKISGLGFQEIYSRHSPTNTEVLIAKMKHGFVIGGMELTDVFGTLVVLKYYYKDERRNLYKMRMGDTHGNEASYRALGLTKPEKLL